MLAVGLVVVIATCLLFGCIDQREGGDTLGRRFLEAGPEAPAARINDSGLGW